MSSGGGGGRRQIPEEHVNHERWLVSYADMVTLLMVLFIILFAIGQIDQEKYAELKAGLSAGFGAPIQPVNGGGKPLAGDMDVVPEKIDLAGGAGAHESPGSQADAVNPDKVAELVNSTLRSQAEQEANHLEQVRKDLIKALKKAGLPKSATFRYDERGLVVSIATDNILFLNASADLRKDGTRILDALGPTLRRVPNRLSVDGHTNSIPIRTARYPSNWELSAERATGVLRYLVSRHHVAATKVTATGFADTAPRLPASDRRAVTVNRRVEIVVLARVDGGQGRTVQQLAEEQSKRG